MASFTRNFGVKQAPGVSVLERVGAGPVQQSGLGTALHVGVYEKGDPQKLTVTFGPRDATKKLGGRITGTLAPDAMQDYWLHSEGNGAFIGVRVTDGLEEKSEITLFSRHWGGGAAQEATSATDSQDQEKIKILKIEAKNGGRWGGRRRFLSGRVANANLVNTLFTTGITLPKDAFKNAVLTVVGATNGTKTYNVVSNTTAGVLTVETGKDLDTDFTGDANVDYYLKLEPTELETALYKGLQVVVKDGAQDSTNEFGLEFWVDGELIRDYPDLSMDTTSKRYVVTTVSDDLSNIDVKVTDLLPTNQALNPDLRPSNFYGQVLGVSSTTLTLKAFQIVSISDANIRIAEIKPSSTVDANDLRPMRLTFTWDLATGRYDVTAAALQDGDADPKNLPQFTVGAAAQYNKKFNASGDIRRDLPEIVVDHNAAVANLATFVIDVLPINFLSSKGLSPRAYLHPDMKNAPLTRLPIKSSTHGVATVESGDPSATATAATKGSVTSTIAQNYNIAAGVSDKMLLAIDGRPDVTVTLVAGAAKTAAQVVTEINAAFDTQFGAGVIVAAAVDAGGTKVVLQSANGGVDGGGATSKVEIKTIATSAYTVLGFTVATTRGANGEEAMISYGSMLTGGYDGDVPGVQKFLDALSPVSGPIKDVEVGTYGDLQLACPGITELLGTADANTTQKQGIAAAEQKGHIYTVELPKGTTTEGAILTFVNTTIARSDFAEIWFPSFMSVRDPDKEGPLKAVPISGAYHGSWARYANDVSRLGYIEPAAGLTAVLSRALQFPTDADPSTKNVEFLTNLGVNTIQKRAGNFVFWGARTIWKNSEFKFSTHRRQMDRYIQLFLGGQFDWVVFKLNDATTWAEVKAVVTEFFMKEQARGVLKGSKPAEGFIVKIDKDTNPSSEIDAGNMNLELELALSNFAERFRVTISKAGVSTGLV